jgi:hypothetical protein
MGRYQPALLGGLLIGVLSNLPGVSAGNVCCCLWVVCGGVLTTYLLQQKTPEPITTSDAMLGGVIAGLVGALITVAVTAVTLNLTGPLWQEPLRRAMEQNPQVTPEIQAFVTKLMSGGGIVLLTACLNIPLYAVFGMLGSLLGVAFFRKKVAPQPPAQPTIQG